MAKRTALALLALIAAACRRDSSVPVSALSEEFVNTSLAFSPVGATRIGLHESGGRKLDELLDDYSAESLDKQRKFYRDFAKRLDAVHSDSLPAQDRADYMLLRDHCTLALMDLVDLQVSAHNPTIYVETLGDAFFAPYELEYAPKAERAKHVVARLKGVRLFLDQAQSNLVSAPAVWTRVAAEENEGNIALVDKTLREWMPEDQKDTFAMAARPALEAMQKFQTFLKETLPARGDADWRLGAKYAPKFRAVMEAGLEPDNMLQQAERDLRDARARMLELALPIHRKIAGAHGDHTDLSGEARENRVIGEVLEHIAEKRSTAASYLDDARKDLEEARQFVIAKKLLTLPQRGNLQVIETPEFLRGIYAVGGFNPAPALEPQLGAYYWVTPIGKNWPKERVDSKLKEYNFYKLKLLTIHEAMPGHYVQFEFANNVEPRSRRLVRSVFGNGPYIEGWGQFATQTMLDEGYLNHAPEMQLTFLKEELRVLANAILDVRLHMLNMTDQEALDLMMKQTFQEKEEATAKLQRAMLSSCQLPTYYVGWRTWRKVREDYRKDRGTAYNLTEFNDRALQQGAVPLASLPALLQ